MLFSPAVFLRPSRAAAPNLFRGAAGVGINARKTDNSIAAERRAETRKKAHLGPQAEDIYIAPFYLRREAGSGRHHSFRRGTSRQTTDNDLG